MRRRHGLSRSPVYLVWRNMLNRCDGKQPGDYRQRGIMIDPRWRSFDAFLADMGLPPHGLTLDRVDNDGHYTKANCRWATPCEQARNRRTTKLNKDSVRQIGSCLKDGSSIRKIAFRFSVARSTIRRIRDGLIWRMNMEDSDA